MSASDRALGELEGHELARVDGDEPVAGGDLAPGEAADDVVLGADPQRPGGQPTDLVQAGLPARPVGDVGDEREHPGRGPDDRQLRLLADHGLAFRGWATGR
jgi:hypothetical protein